MCVLSRFDRLKEQANRASADRDAEYKMSAATTARGGKDVRLAAGAVLLAFAALGIARRKSKSMSNLRMVAATV